MTIALNELVLAYLAAQNVTPAPGDYVIEDKFNGEGPFIASWNVVNLGTQPSSGTLNGLIPQVTIQQSAQSDYTTNLGNGIAITSTATPALNATYGLDPTTLSQIQALANDCAVGFGFPGGAGSFAYPDQTGTPHTFASADMVNLYKAMRNLIYAMQTTLAARLQGNNAGWPSQSATIA